MMEEVDYTDGRWVATTMGGFLQILVDSGQDPCVIFRVDTDIYLPRDATAFVRKLTVFSVPDGAVVPMMDTLKFSNDDSTHVVNKVLAEFLEKRLVR